MPIGRTTVPATDARSADLRAGEWGVPQRGYSMLVEQVICIDFKSQCHGFMGLVDVKLLMDAEVGLAVHFCALPMFYADQFDGVGARRRGAYARSRILRQVHPTTVTLNILTRRRRAGRRPARGKRSAGEHRLEDPKGGLLVQPLQCVRAHQLERMRPVRGKVAHRRMAMRIPSHIWQVEVAAVVRSVTATVAIRDFRAG